MRKDVILPTARPNKVAITADAAKYFKAISKTPKSSTVAKSEVEPY